MASFGDQLNDLAGGFADRTFKLPNPNDFLPERPCSEGAAGHGRAGGPSAPTSSSAAGAVTAAAQVRGAESTPLLTRPSRSSMK